MKGSKALFNSIYNDMVHNKEYDWSSFIDANIDSLLSDASKLQGNIGIKWIKIFTDRNNTLKERLYIPYPRRFTKGTLRTRRIDFETMVKYGLRVSAYNITHFTKDINRPFTDQEKKHIVECLSLSSFAYPKEGLEELIQECFRDDLGMVEYIVGLPNKIDRKIKILRDLSSKNLGELSDKAVRNYLCYYKMKGGI